MPLRSLSWGKREIKDTWRECELLDRGAPSVQFDPCNTAGNIPELTGDLNLH